MSTKTLVIDPVASRIAVRTRAKGLLAALAHDLEIATTEVTGRATLDDGGWSAELSIPVASLHVAGTLHGDRLDPSGLSPSDRAEVERKLREEVLAGTRAVTVKASGTSRDHATVEVSTARGSTRLTTPIRAVEGEGGRVHVSARCELSLRALGIPEVKAPLGAFKVADTVTVLAELELRPEP